MLNYIWGSFFLVGFALALVRFLGGDETVFRAIVQSTFDMAKLSVDISIGLVGLLALWSGLFRVAEKAGLIGVLARLLAPFFSRVMPEVPMGHAAQGAVTMNLAANMLGLDNAATPLGLKAMQALQTLNPTKHTASNAQILFLVLNTSSVTLLPVTIFMYRAQLGAADPTDVFIPILLATSLSSLAGLVTVMLVQKIPFDRVVISYLGAGALLMATFIYWLTLVPASRLGDVSQVLANGVLLMVIALFVGFGLWRRLFSRREGFARRAHQCFMADDQVAHHLFGPRHTFLVLDRGKASVSLIAAGRRKAEGAHAFGNLVHCERQRRILRHEHCMERIEHRTRHVPVIIMRFQI